MRHRTELQIITKVLRKLQEIDPEMQIPSILCFLELAMWDDTKAPSVKDLGAKLGTEDAGSSGSRNIMLFCEKNRYHKPGWDMMQTVENPEYRVEKLVQMKPKGNLFADELIKILKEA